MQQLVFAAVLVLGCRALQNQTTMPSAGDAINYGTQMLMEFANMTQCSSCPTMGCCPIIVTHPPFEAKKSSVIQPVSGYRGNVAIIVDWGPAYWWGRACTTSDRGFIVFVNWGDGQYTIGNLKDFGPYQPPLHQYTLRDCTYGVTVYYCSNPAPHYPSQRCCSSMYRTIDVNFDPSAVKVV